MIIFLTNFFMLRWSLPRWLIPLIWTVYVLEHAWIIFTLIHLPYANTNFPPMAARWQNIASFLPSLLQALWYFMSSQILSLAIVGILLFTAQNLLFGKKD